MGGTTKWWRTGRGSVEAEQPVSQRSDLLNLEWDAFSIPSTSVEDKI